ncbi:MAG: hypothetical protein P8168_06840 [Deltaproteobacteria bacterium]
MMRRLLSRKVWIVIALTLATACWCQPAAAYDLEITSWIDGVSQLIIQGRTVQWHNTWYTVPGKEAGHNDPTNLTTADMGTVTWYPEWPDAIEDPPTGEQDSTQFTGLNLPLAAMDQIVSLTKVAVRDDVFISQQPAAVNEYTLIVDFDDWLSNSADYYTIQLAYIPAVPIPRSLALLGPSLLGLAVFGRHRFIQEK